MRRTDFYENLRGNPKVVEEEKYQKKKRWRGEREIFFIFIFSLIAVIVTDTAFIV